MRQLVFLVVLIATSAHAQEFVPVDKEMWEQLSRELADVDMKLPQHIQVQQKLQNIQREMQMKAARANAGRSPTPPEKKE